VPTLEKEQLNLQDCGLVSAMGFFTEITRKSIVVTKIDEVFEHLEIRAKAFKNSYLGFLNKGMFSSFAMVQSSNDFPSVGTHTVSAAPV